MYLFRFDIWRSFKRVELEKAIGVVAGIIATMIVPKLIHSELWLLLVQVVLVIFIYAFGVSIIRALISSREETLEDMIESFQDESSAISYFSDKLKNWLNEIRLLFPLSLEEVKETDLAEWKPKIPNWVVKFIDLRTTVKKVQTRAQDAKILLRIISRHIQVSEGLLEELILNDRIAIIEKIIEDIDYHFQRVIEALKDIENGKEEVKNSDKVKKILREEILKHKQYFDEAIKALDDKKKVFSNREKFSNIMNIIKQPSTGKATLSLSKLLKVEPPDQLKLIVQLINSRIGFKLSELLGLTEESGNLKWYGKLLNESGALDKARVYWEEFEEVRSRAIEQIQENWKQFIFAGELSEKPIAIALTSGYSAVLKSILEKMCEYYKKNISDIHVTLIKSESSIGDEEILQRELRAFSRTRFSQELKCTILSLDTLVEERQELLETLDRVFIGIESINEEGDVVHPRGGVRIILKLKEVKPDIKVYAFGETYKVQDFDSLRDIDHDKLLVTPVRHIDFVVTDHGFHKKVEKTKKEIKWEVNNATENDLRCCRNHWRKKVISLEYPKC